MLPAVSLRFETLRKRIDFQRAARAARIAKPGFILQMRKRGADEPRGMRVGYTCSKKVGNAVARNRAKRRHGRNGIDYVLIGRRDHTAAVPFDRLLADLVSAVETLHGRAA